jgi:hypothetical protein
MDKSLILVLIYLVPLVIIQVILIFRRDQLTYDVKADITLISCTPLLNILFITMIAGVCADNILTKYLE